MSRPRPSPVFVILLTLLGISTFLQIKSSLTWGIDSWQLGDWLINYSDGYVRRGLPGTVAGALALLTGIQANLVVIAISLACYLALTIWLLRHCTRYVPPALIVSCLIMGFPAYQDSIIRKDCLGLLLMAICLVVQRSSWHPAIRNIMINAISCVAILSHETFAFYALPALVIFHSESPSPNDIRSIWLPVLKRAIALVPAILVFLSTVVFHGTPANALAIHQSWLPLWSVIDPGHPSIMKPAAAIEAIGWTTAQGVSLTSHVWTNGLYQPLAWITVLCMAFVIVLWFIGTNQETDPSDRPHLRLRGCGLLIMQLGFVSPLFVLGVDYGRWMFIWLASTVMLLAVGAAAPRWIELPLGSFFKRYHLGELANRFPPREWYLLLMGIPVCWSFFNFVHANPVMRYTIAVYHWIVGP